jgi:hypothetical protein
MTKLTRADFADPYERVACSWMLHLGIDFNQMMVEDMAEDFHWLAVRLAAGEDPEPWHRK